MVPTTRRQKITFTNGAIEAFTFTRVYITETGIKLYSNLDDTKDDQHPYRAVFFPLHRIHRLDDWYE